MTLNSGAKLRPYEIAGFCRWRASANHDRFSAPALRTGAPRFLRTGVGSLTSQINRDVRRFTFANTPAWAEFGKFPIRVANGPSGRTTAASSFTATAIN